MIDAKQLREDLATVLTCSPMQCPQEAACFRVARALLALLPESVIADPELDSPPDPDTVADYAPDWSGA